MELPSSSDNKGRNCLFFWDAIDRAIPDVCTVDRAILDLCAR